MSALVTCKTVREETHKDPILSRFVRYLQCGWPHDVEPSCNPFVRRKLEISIEQVCLVWGGRVVISPNLREKTLKDLHEAHPGVFRMKAIGLSNVWWPGVDRDIEKLVFNCETCQINQAIDYTSPFQGKMFLIIVDSFSKWLEIITVNNTSSTIKALQQCFTIHGYSQVIISDNGSFFTSEEFTFFVKINGIKHIKSAPYQPATNGCAERAVRTFKTTMKKLKDIESMSDRLQMSLFQYGITPQSIAGKSPAELFMSRKINNRLDIIKPDADSSEVSYPRINRSFEIDKKAWVRNFNLGGKWIPGSIVAVKVPVSYQVSTGIGFLRKHVHRLKKRKHTAPLIKYDFVATPGNSIDKARNEFESRERLPVSEQSLSRDAPLENTPPSPILLN